MKTGTVGVLDYTARRTGQRTSLYTLGRRPTLQNLLMLCSPSAKNRFAFLCNSPAQKRFHVAPPPLPQAGHSSTGGGMPIWVSMSSPQGEGECVVHPLVYNQNTGNIYIYMPTRLHVVMQKGSIQCRGSPQGPMTAGGSFRNPVRRCNTI